MEQNNIATSENDPAVVTQAPVRKSAPVTRTKGISERLFIPGAIVLAGAMIAGAVLYSNRQAFQAQALNTGTNLAEDRSRYIRPVDETDHIRGNPEAAITLVEFSDFQCPYCNMIHATLDRIIKESNGGVRWVYRHFPLTEIHSEAFASAVASECVGELGGNEAFWQFAEMVFNDQQGMGNAQYEKFVTAHKIDLTAFRTCKERKETADRVARDLTDVLNIGGTGTPYVVVMNNDGEYFSFNGALPYEQIKAVIAKAQ